MEIEINNLKNLLQKPLPGAASQYLMAPLNRQKIDLDLVKLNNYKPSAVMILLCLDEEGKNPFIPLTQRFSYDGLHSGQISLPGGKFDADDVSLESTAIRECYEEIGIKDDIEVIGKLTQLYIPISGFLVEPFVGICSKLNPNFSAQEREVKTILKLPFQHLLNDEIMKVGTIENEKNFKIKAPYFLFEDYKIWGATAMILNELKTLAKSTF